MRTEKALGPLTMTADEVLRELAALARSDVTARPWLLGAGPGSRQVAATYTHESGSTRATDSLRPLTHSVRTR
jgi:hypothetical protein